MWNWRRKSIQRSTLETSEFSGTHCTVSTSWLESCQKLKNPAGEKTIYYKKNPKSEKKD